MRLFVVFPFLIVSLSAATSRETLKSLIEQYWQHRLETHPEFATFVGDNRYNDRLTDNSPTAIAREFAYDRKLVTALEQDRHGPALSCRQTQSKPAPSLPQDRHRGERFKNWEMPATQMWGPHLDYAGLAKDMPFKTVRITATTSAACTNCPLSLIKPSRICVKACTTA